MSDEEKPNPSETDEPKITGRKPELSRLLMSYMVCKTAIHKFFGYDPQWREIPISDDTDAAWWHLEQRESGGGSVRFGYKDVREDLKNDKYFSNEIYTQRHLPKYVYRTESHTMISVDTQTDLNVFLAIFDNEKEVTDPELIELIEESV